MAKPSKTLSENEFLKLLMDPKSQKAAGQGKADWDAIYEALLETDLPLDIRTIQEHYVKGVVTRHRTKNKLQEWAEDGKCYQVWRHGKYWFFFGEVPEEVRAVLEEQEEEEE